MNDNWDIGSLVKHTKTGAVYQITWVLEAIGEVGCLPYDLVKKEPFGRRRTIYARNLKPFLIAEATR